MNIRQLINEEIADYISKIADQKQKVDQSIENYESESDDSNKVKKQLRAESEKQKLFKLQALFLKEKVDESRKKVDQYKEQLKVLQRTED